MMMMMMMMKSRRLANGDHRARGHELRVSPPRQRFEGELTGGATTAPEAQYDTL